ncbi:hypothetical protein BpHYR1_030637 [Brachionus plicatilis]|uniref:Uncharacterized protein n=1 Tax=Brachionus plicatilis TaxID=10195 RepID=A0A3M7RE24_BRAPC|nr:hypothetical protein BpHYR1_030637 [Brachionus plicatilis]
MIEVGLPFCENEIKALLMSLLFAKIKLMGVQKISVLFLNETKNMFPLTNLHKILHRVMVKKTLILKEVFDYLEKEEISLGDLIQQIETRTKELKNIKQNGISDSIKICIENIGNDVYRKMLFTYSMTQLIYAQLKDKRISFKMYVFLCLYSYIALTLSFT